MTNGYEVRTFRMDMLPDVLRVLVPLWGPDLGRSERYFQWKYVRNPYVPTPLGIVALKGGTVVGFRGYFATRWRVRGKGRPFTLLTPGDTCVHPDHRMGGLSVAMGNAAMEEYSSVFPLFLNTSGGKNSVPGYLKMGFLPLGKKKFVTRPAAWHERLLSDHALIAFERTFLVDPLARFEKYVHRAGMKSGMIKRGIPFGRDGNLTVSPEPKPKAMHDLQLRSYQSAARISLLQDETFFSWRFDNSRNTYAFFFIERNGSLRAYAVARMIERYPYRLGHIIDYCAELPSCLEDLFTRIIRKRCFDAFSILTLGLDDHFMRFLLRNRFKVNSVERIRERKDWGEWPLLVRPVRKNFSEQDFFIEGMDVRKAENWDIKEICNDGF